MEDSSLDDFLDAENDAEKEENNAPSGEESDDSSIAVDDSPTEVQESLTTADEPFLEIANSSTEDSFDVEPATPTSQWLPDGRPCEACGTLVLRLWTNEERMVCRSCKPWQ